MDRGIYYYYWSFTCKLEVKRTETYSESLKYTEGESHVHIENVFANTPTLHVDFAIVVLVDQLKVFDTCLVYSPVKIQHKGLHLFVPFRWFVEEEHNIVRFILGEFALNTITLNFSVRPENLFSISIHHRQQNLHSSRPFGSEYISLILYHPVLLTGVVFVRGFGGVFLSVKNVKLCSQEV